MSRHDAASISVNFTLPPEVIREYFDGMAKVESAKHTSSGSGFDWSSLLSLAPLVIPLLTDYMKPMGRSNSIVRFPEPKTELVHHIANEDSDKSDTKPDIVISFMQKPTELTTTSTETSDVEEEEHKKTDEMKECEKTDESVLAGMTDGSSVAAKPKRPVYQEGDNVVVDLKDFKDLAGTFSGDAAGSISEMMKMFAPMMEGLMGGINGMNMPKPEETKPVATTDKNSELVETKQEECDSKESEDDC